MKNPFKREVSEFLLLSFLLFLVAYVHASLRISKNVLVMSFLGTELISAIKFWVVLPLTIVFMFGYMKLTDCVSRIKLAHLMNWFLVSFFILFIWVIYPNIEKWRWMWIENSWLGGVKSLRYLKTVLVNWPFSLFYFFSEMWVTIMYSITAWQIINQLSSTETAKKFYPWYAFFGSLGSLGGSFVIKSLAKFLRWEQSLQCIIYAIIFVAFLFSMTLILLTKLVGKEAINNFKRVDKEKVGFLKSLRVVFKSKIIALITTLLLCYNISINLIEGTWRKSFEIFFNHDAVKIQKFNGEVQFYISVFSLIFAWLGYSLLKRFGWRSVASICPLIFLIFGSYFFYAITNHKDFTFGMICLSSLQMAVYFGAIHNIFASSSKRVLFDSTKEMAYLPLSDELKSKGKAAAELIGMRFGKACGSMIQQFLLMLPMFGNLIDLAPVVWVVYVVLVVCWIYAVFSLSKHLNFEKKFK